jgi:hypothetical protein
MGTNGGVWGWEILKHSKYIKFIYNTKKYQMIQLGKPFSYKLHKYFVL